MIAHDSWWSNERARFNYHRLSSTIIDYHVPFDQGFSLSPCHGGKAIVTWRSQSWAMVIGALLLVYPTIPDCSRVRCLIKNSPWPAGLAVWHKANYPIQLKNLLIMEIEKNPPCSQYTKHIYLAYNAGQVHNRTIGNTLVDHNFCNSLRH